LGTAHADAAESWLSYDERVIAASAAVGASKEEDALLRACVKQRREYIARQLETLRFYEARLDAEEKSERAFALGESADAH
jgi:hypothetical protein